VARATQACNSRGMLSVIDDVQAGVVTTSQPTEVQTDAASTAVVYQDHYARLVRLAFLMTGSRTVAEEVVQDAFVRLQQRWRTVRDPAGYVTTSVVNGARGHLRHRRVEARWLGAQRAARAGREEQAQEGPDLVWDTLRRLPHKQRVALVMRYYDDQPDAAIAAILGVRPATVRSLIHRGLHALREETRDED
jgi:RNA polymerase sigma factor (sigma-70 family)